MKKRNEIEEKYKWDLSGYCTDLDSAISRIKSLVPEFEKLTKYENNLGNDELLFECLETNRKLGEKFEVLACFCSLKQKEDATVSKTNEILNVIEFQVIWVSNFRLLMLRFQSFQMLVSTI